MKDSLLMLMLLFYIEYIYYTEIIARLKDTKESLHERVINYEVKQNGFFYLRLLRLIDLLHTAMLI